MAGIGRTVATIRIFGDDLDPDEISTLLGAKPIASARKGEVRQFSSGRDVVACSGSWQFSAEDCCPGDLNVQIRSMFLQLTNDLAAWQQISHRYDFDMFCGLFMSVMNEGEDLQPDVLSMLCDRGLRLGLDVYGPTTD